MGRSKKTTNSLYLLTIIISILCVIWVVLGVEWSQFWWQIKSFKLRYLPVLLFVYILSHVIRAWRWKFLLGNEERLDLVELLFATWIGFTATFLLPLRAGEFIRPWLLSRTTPVRFTEGFASIIVERVLDLLLVLGLFGFCSSLMVGAPAYVHFGARSLGLLAVFLCLPIAAVYIVGVAWFEGFIARHVEPGLTRFGEIGRKISASLVGLLKGLLGVRTASDFLKVVVATVLVWLTTAAFYSITLWAMEGPEGLVAGILIAVLVALMVAVPSAPGFIGTFQVGCMIALHSILGYPKEFALAYAVICHMLQFIMNVAIGLTWLAKRGYQLSSFKDLAP